MISFLKLWCIQTALLQQLLFLDLGDILHKNYQCNLTRGGLISICNKIEPVKKVTK